MSPTLPAIDLRLSGGTINQYESDTVVTLGDWSFSNSIDTGTETRTVSSSNFNKLNLFQSIKKVQELGKLEEGWAGDGSIPPSETTIHDTVAFLTKLPDMVVPPNITPASDGEIVLEWFSEEKEAVVGLDGDGFFGYTLLVDGKFRPGQVDGSLGDELLPEDLTRYLCSMLSK